MELETAWLSPLGSDLVNTDTRPGLCGTKGDCVQALSTAHWKEALVFFLVGSSLFQYYTTSGKPRRDSWSRCSAYQLE